MPSSTVRATKASKSSSVPSSGWTASWPPSSEPIAQGEPGSSRADVGRLAAGELGGVRALAVDLADRVDRRQVDDVEAHLGDGGQALHRGAEGAAAQHAVGVGRGALAAREELVPGAVERALAVDPDLAARALADQPADRRGRAQQPLHLGGRSPRASRSRRVAGGVAQDGRRAARLGRRRAVEQPGALLEHHVDVDARLDLERRVVPPGAERVVPAAHDERPQALARRARTLGATTRRCRWRRAPSAGAAAPRRRGGYDDVGTDRVVPLPEHPSPSR